MASTTRKGTGRKDKEEEIKVQRMKHPAQSWATDRLLREEEQNGKQKKYKRKKTGSRP